MEPKLSLSRLQVPATCTYPEPDQFDPCPPFQFLNIHVNIILPSTPEYSEWFLSPIFSTKTLYTPKMSYIIRLDLITQIILCVEYR